MKNVDVVVKEVLTAEEGYKLTEDLVSYYYETRRFYTLNYYFEKEDLVHDLYIKFIEQKLFEKYDSSRCAKWYFVKVSVYRSLIDKLRTLKEYSSIDIEIFNDGTTLADVLPTKEVYVNHEENIQMEQLINMFPDDNRSKYLEGHSPLMGECQYSYRTIVRHLLAGYSPTEISHMFYNTKTHKVCTSANIFRTIKYIRVFAKNNVPLFQ